MVWKNPQKINIGALGYFMNNENVEFVFLKSFVNDPKFWKFRHNIRNRS